MLISFSVLPTRRNGIFSGFLFLLSGVGANTARMMLSSLNPAEIEKAIIGSDVNLLKSVKGIGLKTAQRIIVDLKDKAWQTSRNR
ncbi:MAG: helix-hairpin-helix domain-containing protein [Marinilabiliales bacterium]|nr:helix-hairpin-helix domain-containing protein [Marinilabiliales bacterium]